MIERYLEDIRGNNIFIGKIYLFVRSFFLKIWKIFLGVELGLMVFLDLFIRNFRINIFLGFYYKVCYKMKLVCRREGSRLEKEREKGIRGKRIY